MTYVTGKLDDRLLRPERGLPTSASGTMRSTAAPAIPTSIRRPGIEFSAVLGFTYNFENTHTQYQNGVDMHRDWGASRFVTKELQLGMVGYAYKQISCDTGAGNRVGCFEAQVFGVGPQIGVDDRDGPPAGLPQPERLLGIRGRAPRIGLEYLARHSQYHRPRRAGRRQGTGP